ncbi:hypothetical protein HOY82DRAFT_616434 [Tuber indicum]|nr:hypothetical protein HOY82DRAFT_616434 [Tuber indicum]
MLRRKQTRDRFTFTMVRWSNSGRTALPLFLLLLRGTLPFSSAGPAAAVGADLRLREANPQEWEPPETVTVTVTTRYTLTVLTTLTIDPGISTSIVISGPTSTTKSTTTWTSTLIPTTTTTITPTSTAAPKIRRQVQQQPSTVTITITIWAFPDVTITSTITAPASRLTTMTSMSMSVTTDIVTESTTATSIVTATATAGTMSAAGQEAVKSKKKGPQVEVIIGATCAASIFVALLVFLYVKFGKGREDRAVAVSGAGAVGATGAGKRHTPYVGRPMSAIKSLLHTHKQPYNPVPASDTNMLNPANTSSSTSAPSPRLSRHSYTYSPPPAPTFPATAAPSTYLPVSPTPPRLPQIYVTRTNTSSTVSSLSSSGHSDQPVPIYPLTAAGARPPPVRDAQFHALTTPGEERRMIAPPQPVEPEALWYGLNRGGSGSSSSGRISLRRKPFP